MLFSVNIHGGDKIWPVQATSVVGRVKSDGRITAICCIIVFQNDEACDAKAIAKLTGIHLE
jgi:hypothetical protein